MSLEYYAKYDSAERKETYSTASNPVVVFLGLTIADLGVAIVTFILLAMVFDSPFLGFFCAVASALIRKEYSKRFTRGAFVHWLWSRRFLKKKNVPNLCNAPHSVTFSP